VKQRHQGARDTSPPERQEVESRLLRSVDRVLATASDEVFELVRLGAEVDRVKMVPCGVDLSLFRPDGPADPRAADRGGGLRRLVVVSRLVERKGVGNVVTALASVPGAELVIAGGPDIADLGADRQANRLQALATATGVADRVHLRGRVGRTEVPALLRSADVVVCVPWYEPFGIVPLEAMACGVPVVATAVGGLVDTVVDGVTGVHVPPRDPDRLAEVLRGLLGDPALLHRLGAAGARRARARFSWARVARSSYDVYSELLEPELAARIPVR
jgi:D-inositol-3-phosphate glycosyltransferase